MAHVVTIWLIYLLYGVIYGILYGSYMAHIVTIWCHKGIAHTVTKYGVIPLRVSHSYYMDYMRPYTDYLAHIVTIWLI